MKIRFGFLMGFLAGYYLGAMAGRERYDQLNKAFEQFRKSHAVDVATDKAKAATSKGYERAKDKIDHRLHHNSNGNHANPEVFSPS